MFPIQIRKTLLGATRQCLCIVVGAISLMAVASCEKEKEAKDLTYFLKRMRTIDHLPELENSHTALSSTWDTTGMNADGEGFKNVKGNYNVLLDADGPGCVYRLFTGVLWFLYETRIQVFIDHNESPLYDMEAVKFFDSHNGPFPYPLSFHKTYPGILFPIPYAKHCKIQLVSKCGTKMMNEHKNTNWGNFWQITYATFPPETKVKSLQLPLTSEEKEELEKVCRAWRSAESEPPSPPAWTIDKTFTISKGKSSEVHFDGSGIINEIRIAVSPNTAAVLQHTRFKIRWDKSRANSVDVPLGYFFGNADYQNEKQFSSLLLGITDKEVYARFPMPFKEGFTIVFENKSQEEITNLHLAISAEKKNSIPADYGYFHARWTEIQLDSAHYDEYPRFGKSPKPFLVLADINNCKGKYVGNLLHVAWPYPDWWGEGDWLIWTDESAFPPRYHGTGTEEYYNSGWCVFDKKAVSGFIAALPANVNVYSFHLNDYFQFQKNLRVAVEVWWLTPGMWRSIHGSTAFWYADKIQDAQSKQELISPRLTHEISANKFKWE